MVNQRCIVRNEPPHSPEFNARTWTLVRTCVRAWVIKYDERQRVGGGGREAEQGERSRAGSGGSPRLPERSTCRFVDARLPEIEPLCTTEITSSWSTVSNGSSLPFLSPLSSFSLFLDANINTRQCRRRIDLSGTRVARKFAGIACVRLDIKSRCVLTCE